MIRIQHTVILTYYLYFFLLTDDTEENKLNNLQCSPKLLETFTTSKKPTSLYTLFSLVHTCTPPQNNVKLSDGLSVGHLKGVHMKFSNYQMQVSKNPTLLQGKKGMKAHCRIQKVHSVPGFLATILGLQHN